MRVLEQISSNEFVEEEQGFKLRVFMLGVKKDQIDVLIDGRYLWISAKQTPANDFQKPYLLPNRVSVKSAQAIYHESILTIHFRKGIFQGRSSVIKVKVRSQSKLTTLLIGTWKALKRIVQTNFKGKSR